MRELGDTTEHAARRFAAQGTVSTLMEHEHGNTEESQLSCRISDEIRILFHGIADEHHRIDFLAAGFFRRMAQQAFNLRSAAEELDTLHECNHLRGIACPWA